MFIKADVVHRVYLGRLERAVEWVSAHVAAALCPPYKQNADEQLSLFVRSLSPSLNTNSFRIPYRKKYNGIRSGDGGGH
ncbi:hypothetical protein TNCV_1266471 [Trichonephila clavipes]|nr:hypothetical protein TNCV_1266471 [Trichonephila clavipes]